MNSIAKINIPHFTIRLLTVLAYFLPFTFFFTTCTDILSSEDSFNTDQAIINEAKVDLAKKERVNIFLDSMNDNNVDSVKSVIKEFIRINYSSEKREFITQDLVTKIFFPNNNSLSGIGVIYYFKNTLGQILISISLVLSILALFLLRFLSRKNILKYVLYANIVTIICFVINCIYNSIDIRFGTWTLLALLISQLLHEIQQSKHKPTNNFV